MGMFTDFLDNNEFDDEVETNDFAAVDRGVVGDVGSLLGRTAISIGETFENSLEAVGIGDSSVSTMAKLRNIDYFKPDLDEALGEGWLSELKVFGKSLGSLPSAFESAGPSLATAGAGFAAGALMGGGPITGVIGAAIASLGIMGAADYQQTLEYELEKGTDPDLAQKIALEHGAIEGLGESAATVIGLGPLGKLFKKPMIDTARQLLKTPIKDMATGFAKLYGKEQLTEIGQSVGQTIVSNQSEDGSWNKGAFENALETVIPTAFMTLGFGAATNTMQTKQKKRLLNDLENGTPREQLEASATIYNELKQQDEEVASAWNKYAGVVLGQGQKINIDKNFVAFEGESAEVVGTLDKVLSDEITGDQAEKVIQDALKEPYLGVTKEKVTGAIKQVGKQRVKARNELEPIKATDSKVDDYQAEIQQPRSSTESTNARMQSLLDDYSPDLPPESVSVINARMDALMEEYSIEVPKMSTFDRIEAEALMNEALEKVGEDKKADVQSAIDNIMTASEAADLAANQSVLKGESSGLVREGTEATTGVKFPKGNVEWGQDTTIKVGDRLSAGWIGTLAGSPNKYTITEAGQIVDGKQTKGYMVRMNRDPINEEDTVYNTRDEAWKAVEKHALTQETALWKDEKDGRKIVSSTATLSGTTYKISGNKNALQVTANGKKFLNPATGKAWGKGMTHAKIKAALEKETGSVAKPTVSNEGSIIDTVPLSDTLAELMDKPDYSWGESNDTESKRIAQLVTDVVAGPLKSADRFLQRGNQDAYKQLRAQAQERSDILKANGTPEVSDLIDQAWNEHAPKTTTVKTKVKSAGAAYDIERETTVPIAKPVEPEVTEEEVVEVEPLKSSNVSKAPLLGDKYEGKELTLKMKTDIRKEIKKTEASLAIARGEEYSKAVISKLDKDINSLYKVLGEERPGLDKKTKDVISKVNKRVKEDFTGKEQTVLKSPDTFRDLAEIAAERRAEESTLEAPPAEYGELNKDKPQETTALEILEQSDNELAPALLQGIPKEKLESLPVSHNPDITAPGQFVRSEQGNRIELAGNESTTKVHEVIHGVTANEMEQNPEKRAEVRSLMDIFESQLTEEQRTEDVLYALKSEDEFLSQMMSKQELQGLASNMRDGKATVWKKFVEFVRKTVGLSPLRTTLLDKTLRTTLEIANIETVEQGGDTLFANHGVKSKLANIPNLKTAILSKRAGSTPKEVLENTGWFQFDDNKWRFYVPDTKVGLTGDGRGVVTRLLEEKEKNPETDISKGVETEIGNLIDLDAIAEGYPEIADIPLHFKWDDTGRSKGSILTSIDTNEIVGMTVNVGQIVKEMRDETASDAIKEVVVHELQHIIQGKEGFSSGGNGNVNRELNIVLARKLFQDSMAKAFPDMTEQSESIIGDEAIGARVEEILMESQNIHPSTAKMIAVTDAMQDLRTAEPAIYEGALEWAMDNNVELFHRISYSEAQEINGYQQSPNRSLDFQTYERLLGETEARLQSALVKQDVSTEEFNSGFDPERFQEYKQTIPVEESGGVYSLQESAEAPAVEETPEARRERIVTAQQGTTDRSGLRGILSDAKEFGKKVIEGAEALTRPINDILHRIDKRLPAKQRIAEAKISNANKTTADNILQPFFKKAIKMTDEDKALFKAGYINNSDREIFNELLEKYKMTEEFETVKKWLKKTEKDNIRIGALHRSQVIKDWMPRVVTHENAIKLYNALQGTEQQTALDQMIHKEKVAKEKKEGEGSFTREDRADAVARGINSGRFNFVPKPGFLKNRKIEHVPADMLQYYEDPIDSLLDYMYKHNEMVGMRTMIGQFNRKSQLNELHALATEIDSLKDGEKKSKLQKKYMEMAESLESLEEDTNTSVGVMLDEFNLSPEDKVKAMRLFRARLAQRGTSGITHTIKNVALAISIGNPMSAVTQLGDQGFNLSDNGVYGLQGIAKAMTGDDKLMSNFDITNTMREFSKDEGSTHRLDQILTLSGLKKMDTFGKESYAQGAMIRYGNMPFKRFKEEAGEYAEYLDGEGSPEEKLMEAWDSMKKGKPNMNAVFMLHAQLATRQPLSLSETSETFLGAGNRRIFYVLKSFALRAVSSAVVEIEEGFRSGNPAKGILKAVSLIAVLGMAGAGTDEIKNIMLQREGEDNLTDATVSNIMEIMFMNRYSLETGMKQGKTLQSLIANQLMLPPVRLADNIITDVVKTMQGDFSYKTMAHIPLGGRLVYDYTPAGRESEAKRLRRSIMERLNEGAGRFELGGDIENFNRQATGEAGMEKITAKSIKNARKRARLNQ